MQAAQHSPALPRPRKETNLQFANDGSYKSVELLLFKLAMKCFARAQAMGVSMTFDDVHQEMNVSYVLAKNTWNPERGVLFNTYMTTCCYRNFNELMRRMGLERQRLGLVNMSDMKSVSHGESDDDDPMERMDAQVELSAAAVYGELTIEGNAPAELTAPMSADPAVLRERLHDLHENREAAKEKLRLMTDNTKAVLGDLLKAASERQDDNERLPRFAKLLQARGYSPEECRRIRKEIANAFGVKVI